MKSKLIALFLILARIVAAEEEPQIESASEKTCPFSAVAAEGTEWLICQGETHPFLKGYTDWSARALSVLVFPVTSMADIFYHSYHLLSEREKYFFSLDEKSRSFHEQQWLKNKENLKRSWLGFITSPAGIIYPDLVTQHFVPPKDLDNTIIPYGKLYSIHAYEVYPESAADVQNIFAEARQKRKKISVMGAGMSQGKQALPSEEWNYVINTSRMNKIDIDPENRTATVQAGATWADLQREANGHGLAVRVMQASNIFSIGGSLSVNCHGWDHKSGNLRNTVLEITLVDPSGAILHLTPEDELFDFVIGGYGGFGVISEAKIALTENVQMLEVGEEVSPQDYFAYFNEHIRDDETVDMHLYRLSLEPRKLFASGVAVNYLNNGNAGAGELTEEPERGNRMDRIKLHTIRRLKWLRKLAWKMEKNEAMKEKMASRNEIMRPPINPIFNNSQLDTEWLQEYFVSGEELADFISFLGRVLEKNKVPIFNASVRYVKQDSQTKLSYAKEGDRFAIVLFFNQKLTAAEIGKTEKWVQEVIQYLIAHNGTYYLPYQHFATVDQFRSCYPDWEAVAERKQLCDPDALLQNGLYADYLSPPEKPFSYFRSVFESNDQRQAILSFLSSVFMQFNEERIFTLVDEILQNRHLNDDEIYQALIQNINRAKPNPLFLSKRTLYSLSSLKSDLSRQVKTLVGAVPIQGYVEIGYTGRLINPLKKELSLEGPIYVINEKEKFKDFIEIGGLRNYDRFVKLNDYAPISEEEIPSCSVDLVSCYIGLHHIPSEKVGPFLKSIHRILRPGGKFILMDHDAKTDELKILAHVAHDLFNAGTGVSPEENRSELRNFQALDNWIQIVESEGFKYNTLAPLIREGDSTLNSLVRFDKPGDLSKAIVAALKQLPNYTRASEQTYMTAPEWQNVRASQQYAAFLSEHPAYKFPYFKEIGHYWEVMGRSWSAARKEHPFSQVLFSEYFGMDLVVGMLMTIEYGIKGAIALPFCLLPEFSKSSLPELERIRALQAYGAFIEQTPFYQYPYFADIALYWQAFGKSFHLSLQSFKDLFVGLSITVENTIKAILSAPFRWIYGSGKLKEAERIGMVVRFPGETLPDPRVRLIESYPENLKYIEIPRYMEFKDVLLSLSEHLEFELIDIAGNSQIQVDAYRIADPISGCAELYPIPIGQDLIAYDVQIGSLPRLLREAKNHIVLIHDY